MFLLDTDVVSVLAPQRHQSFPALVQWLHERSDELHLSAVTIAEVEAGAARLRRTGASGKAAKIGRWIDAIEALFSARILAFDTAVARIAGQLHDRARAAGIEPGFADIAIAATAERHGLTLLTRNVRHFAPLGVSWHDPFAALPGVQP